MLGLGQVVTVRRPRARTAPRNKRASLGAERRARAAASHENHWDGAGVGARVSSGGGGGGGGGGAMRTTGGGRVSMRGCHRGPAPLGVSGSVVTAIVPVGPALVYTPIMRYLLDGTRDTRSLGDARREEVTLASLRP